MFSMNICLLSVAGIIADAILSRRIYLLCPQIWFQVKAANPHLSVCQLGAMIGRMWRELTEDDKRKHLDDFHQDKVRVSVQNKVITTMAIKPIDNHTSAFILSGL